MSTYKYSVTLLQEIERIEKSEYFRMFNDLVHSHFVKAVEKCMDSRDDVRFYQGMVRAFQIILGKNDMPSIHHTVKETVKKGVAGEQPVPME
jgi:hypothetical protein